MSGLREHALQPRLTSRKARLFRFERSAGFDNIRRRHGPHRSAFGKWPAGHETRDEPPAIAIAGACRIDKIDRVRWRMDQDAALGVADERSTLAELRDHVAFQA
jgi:hypothetical protein